MAFGSKPAMPAVEKPKPMPVVDDEQDMRTKAKSYASMSQRMGRQSTILGGTGGQTSNDAPTRQTMG